MKSTSRLLCVFAFLIAAFFASSLFIQKVKAAQVVPTVPVTGAYNDVCLKAERIGGHVAQLTGSGLPVNTTIYLVGCVAFNDTHYCQTGSAANDAALEKLNFPINPYPTHKLTWEGANPVTTTTGSITATATSVVIPSTDHTFLAVFASQVQQITGSASSPQYGTFNFQQDPGQCVPVQWDPSGRVFDAQSLEPLPNTTVTLYSDAINTQLVTQPVLQTGELNPQKPDVDGQFNFDVLDGTYYLNSARTGYTFPVEQSQVQSNYLKAYWCDESTKTYVLYTKPPTGKEYPIKVAGAAVHCDVPMTSTSGIPYHGVPVTIQDDSGRFIYDHMLIPGTTVVRYEGRVSHPFTKIALVDPTSNQNVAEGAADKNGSWQILLDNSKLPGGGTSPLNLLLTKVDLTQSQTTGRNWNIFAIIAALFSPKPVSAQTLMSNNGVVFEPIFTYLEGYAYDRSGKVLPNAGVAIKVNGSKVAQYQTTADANGFFSVPPGALPIFSYYIEITPANSLIKIDYTTSQFAKMNQQYLTSNNVNLLTAEKKGQSLLPTRAVSPVSQAVAPSNPPAISPVLLGSQTTLILTVVMLVVLILVAGGILIYIKKKGSKSNDLPQKQEPPGPNQQ